MPAAANEAIATGGVIDGQHAPVEDEHVHGHLVEAELLQRGRDQDGEEDVAGRGGEAETEDQAGDGAHDEQQEDIAAGDAQQIVGEAGDDAGHGERADQQAAAGQDGDQLDEGLAVDLEELDPPPPSPVLAGDYLVEQDQGDHAPQDGMGNVVPQHGPGESDGHDERRRVAKSPRRWLRPLMQDDEKRRGVERRVALALEVQKHDHEQHDDQQVVPAFLDGIAAGVEAPHAGCPRACDGRRSCRPA